MSKSPYTPEERVWAAEAYLHGEQSVQEICKKLKIKRQQTVRRWIYAYQYHGSAAFIAAKGNRKYSKKFKKEVVEEYISGAGSLLELCAKHNIPTESILRRWIKQYNSNMKLTDYDPKPEVYMATARRKTTIDERREIVEYCLSHEKDYKGTAENYDVSYSQVYSWTRSYLANGPDGLKDNRGRRKADEELSEVEKLRRENLRLKRQLEDERKAVELLKKVKEFEGRRYSGKENKNQNI